MPASVVIPLAKPSYPIAKTSVDGSKTWALSSSALLAESLQIHGSSGDGEIFVFKKSVIASRYDQCAVIKPGQTWNAAVPPSAGLIDLSSYYIRAPRGTTVRGHYSPSAISTQPTIIAGGDQLVLVNGSTTAVPAGTTGDVSITATATQQTLNRGHLSRMRQCGAVTQVEFYVAHLVNVRSLRIQFWRRNMGTVSLAGTYILVGQTEDLRSKIRSGYVNTITLAEPVYGVQDGDYCGFLLQSDTPGTAVSNVLKTETPTGWTVTTYADVAAPGIPQTDVAYWESAATGYASASFGYVIGVRMQSPTVCAIGDSLVSGSNTETNFCPYFRDETEAWVPENSFLFNLCGSYGVNYINAGTGGNTTTQIAARIANLTDTKCKVAIVQGGVNDLVAAGASGPFVTPKATFLANWTTIFNALAVAAGPAVIVALKMFPWTGDGAVTYGTNLQMTARDDWNAALVTLAATYTTALAALDRPPILVIDSDSTLGQFRSGGTAGNLWDIKTAYRDAGATGVHLNDAGYVAEAAYIKTTLDAFLLTNNLSL